MSTSSWIGFRNKDKTIRFIYCHHDGYIKNGVGETLVKHYSDPETINKLLDLGDLSALGTEPVENLLAWDDNARQSLIRYVLVSPEEYFKEYNRLYPKNQCECYKTRGDENWEANIEENEKIYGEKFEKTFNDYCYLYKNDKWYYKAGKTWQKVTDRLKGKGKE